MCVNAFSFLFYVFETAWKYSLLGNAKNVNLSSRGRGCGKSWSWNFIAAWMAEMEDRWWDVQRPGGDTCVGNFGRIDAPKLWKLFDGLDLDVRVIVVMKWCPHRDSVALLVLAGNGKLNEFRLYRISWASKIVWWTWWNVHRNRLGRYDPKKIFFCRVIIAISDNSWMSIWFSWKYHVETLSSRFRYWKLSKFINFEKMAPEQGPEESHAHSKIIWISCSLIPFNVDSISNELFLKLTSMASTAGPVLDMVTFWTDSIA